MNTNQRAEKKAGIFHFKEGSKKERRREEYASLIGEHLVTCLQAGDLFSAFNAFASKKDSVHEMAEKAEKMEEEGARPEAGKKAYDDSEQAFHQDSAYADYDSEEEEK